MSRSGVRILIIAFSVAAFAALAFVLLHRPSGAENTSGDSGTATTIVIALLVVTIAVLARRRRGGRRNGKRDG